MARWLNVSVKTLQRWGNEGLPIAYKNHKNRRYCTEDQYLKFIRKYKKKIEGDKDVTKVL